MTKSTGKFGCVTCGAPPKFIKAIRALESTKADLIERNEALKIELRELGRERVRIERSRSMAKETNLLLRFDLKYCRRQLRLAAQKAQ